MKTLQGCNRSLIRRCDDSTQGWLAYLVDQPDTGVPRAAAKLGTLSIEPVNSPLSICRMHDLCISSTAANVSRERPRF